MIESRLRRVVSRAGNAVLWVAAVLGALSLVLGLATVVAGVQPLIFRSSSMAPAIDAGALGLARTVPASDVKIGDVISVDDAEGVRVTHRVVKVSDGEGSHRSFTLQGDSNRSPDEQPYFASEVDRVFFDVPYLGYVANWLASPWAMFAAGILVALLIASLWNRRSEFRGSPGAGTGAAAVAALGLAAASLLPVPRTEAYFSDPAAFEAGTIQAHQVRIFDLADSDQCVESSSNIVINWKISSPRYRTLWYRTSVGGAISGSPLKIEAPSGAANSAVSTTFTKAQVSTTVGAYELAAISQLKGSATTPWRSAEVRRVGVRIDDTGIRCGTTNLPPTLSVSAPTDGQTYGSTTLADIAVAAACLGLRAPCGTTTDANGIGSVEYRLQRANWLGTQCWDPTNFWGAGFYLTQCGEWRPAVTAPSTPNNSTSAVGWRVPLGSGGPGTTFNQRGEYALYLRIKDNASPQATTERTIRFTVG